MKNGSTTNLLSFRAAIRTAARAARRKAFRNDQPVAISKNGKVVFVYKNNQEIEVHPSAKSK